MANRELSRGYQEAKNQVAVLVGESALMASIRYMPEETILLLDKSPAMTAYMTRYIQALRVSEDIEEWNDLMGFSDEAEEYPEGVAEIMRDLMHAQAEHWTRAGYEHPVLSHAAFQQAQALALRKVIVPWRANITDGKAMNQLGKVLRAYEASVTLLNLTNVLVCDDDINTSRQAADCLDALPFVSDVPVLLTSGADRTSGDRFPFTHPARMFFGLDDLRENGGSTDTRSLNLGPAITPVVRS